MALGKGLQSLIPQPKARGVWHRETNDAGANGERVWQIPLKEITPNPSQPRRTFSHQELEDLVLSIKQHGILQPITVTEKTSGGYELIAGERRLRAATIAGLPTIPALVRAATDQEKLELALIENIQRQDLDPIEEAFAYRRLTDEFGLTQEEVAKQVGKSRSVIANTVRLLDLPDTIQKALMDREISVGKAKALLSLRDAKEQLAAFKILQAQPTATVREVERQVADHGPASRKGSVRRDPNISAQEHVLEERLGTKVTISRRGERGQISIAFYSNEEFQRLMQELS